MSQCLEDFMLHFTSFYGILCLLRMTTLMLYWVCSENNVCSDKQVGFWESHSPVKLDNSNSNYNGLKRSQPRFCLLTPQLPGSVLVLIHSWSEFPHLFNGGDLNKNSGGPADKFGIQYPPTGPLVSPYPTLPGYQFTHRI